MLTFGPQSKTYQKTLIFFISLETEQEVFNQQYYSWIELQISMYRTFWYFRKSMLPRLPEWELVLCCSLTKSKSFGMDICPSMSKHFVKKAGICAAGKRLEQKVCLKQVRDKMFVAFYLDCAWSFMTEIISWQYFKNYFSLSLRHLSGHCDKNTKAAHTNRFEIQSKKF